MGTGDGYGKSLFSSFSLLRNGYRRRLREVFVFLLWGLVTGEGYWKSLFSPSLSVSSFRWEVYGRLREKVTGGYGRRLREVTGEGYGRLREKVTGGYGTRSREVTGEGYGKRLREVTGEGYGRSREKLTGGYGRRLRRLREKVGRLREKVTAFKTFCSNKLTILTGTSVEVITTCNHCNYHLQSL